MSEGDVNAAAPVTGNVVDRLFKHLDEQSRLNGMSREELANRLTSNVAQGVRMPVGSGRYLIDISSTMKGEEMYVMVDDLNEVIDAYDADSALELHANTPAAALVPPPSQPPPAAPAQRSAPPPPPPKASTDDPVMLTWQSPGANTSAEESITAFTETTHGKVAQEVLRLIVQGVDAETIRVWSKVSQPKLRVDL